MPAPVFRSTTLSSAFIQPSWRSCLAAAYMDAPSGHTKLPSSDASSFKASSMALSDTALAIPLVL